jgi:hypothetical protein
VESILGLLKSLKIMALSMAGETVLQSTCTFSGQETCVCCSYFRVFSYSRWHRCDFVGLSASMYNVHFEPTGLNIVG